MTTCNQESAIAAALATGELSDELHRHLENCAVCGQMHSVMRKMRQMADGLAAEPLPSAASMWWRLSLRTRRERALHAQAPLIWMARIFYVAIVLLAAFAIASVPSTPAVTIGLAALGVVAIPVALALWGWSRSGS